MLRVLHRICDAIDRFVCSDAHADASIFEMVSLSATDMKALGVLVGGWLPCTVTALLSLCKSRSGLLALLKVAALRACCFELLSKSSLDRNVALAFSAIR